MLIEEGRCLGIHPAEWFQPNNADWSTEQKNYSIKKIKIK